MSIENKHIEQCTAEEVIGAVIGTYSDISERPIYQLLQKHEGNLNILPTLIRSVGDTATALTTINEILGEL
jgi:hypothetical protein